MCSFNTLTSDVDYFSNILKGANQEKQFRSLWKTFWFILNLLRLTYDYMTYIFAMHLSAFNAYYLAQRIAHSFVVIDISKLRLVPIRFLYRHD